MYRLTAEIRIEGARRWLLEEVTGVEIERDTEKLTTECRITLPKRMKWDGEAETPVRGGDRVEVRLGYDGKLEPAFAGYVREVGFKTPVVLECEDEMYAMKRKKAKKLAYKSVTLGRLLRDQDIGCPVHVTGEQAIGAYRVVHDTVAELLSDLSKNGVRCFFAEGADGPELYAGVLFDHAGDRTLRLGEGVNIVSDSSLEQEKAENIRLKVKAISLKPDNKKVKVEVGDADGELRTLHTYNKTKEELKAWAEQEMKRLKRDGLKGSVTAFGAPFLAGKTDAVSLRLDGREMGTYRVKANRITYGTGGFRQEITLGMRIKDK